MNKIQIISKIPLFNGLPVEHIQDLASIALEKKYDAGCIIFSEGDEANGFYIVISGRVKIFKLSPEGKEQILHIFGSGEPFAEVAVFDDIDFPASAETLEETITCFFQKNAFIRLISRSPRLALRMLAELSRRLHYFAQLVDDLALKEVPARLARYLLTLQDRQNGEASVALEISKGQLASILGTIPETLSRAISKMTKAGLIESRGSELVILNQTALEELSWSGRMAS
jgi:CRP/FNR family transcriptional regulator, dissimilatory nitrate respiration regulator